MTAPEIAIIGHPNEGKSSVLSTLAEDDSVRVSPVPGETTECRTFPVVIDGREVLRFTDTPGFQNPGRLLAELRTLTGSSDSLLSRLREFALSQPELRDDGELLLPVERGAGIIYVVDGSRPVRNVDRAEMEILRLLGRPRMAVINCKNDDYQFLDSWKDEFRKNFNSSRVFNAHRATYAERIELLKALQAIDQDWQPLLSQVVNAIEQDWNARARNCSEIICRMLRKCLSLQLVENIPSTGATGPLEQKLLRTYSTRIADLETRAHQQIRALFKHNIFNYQLPPHSILREDLFNEKTWQLLGLTQKQLVIIGGLSGAAVGAGIDIAALGHGLGLFTTLGTIAGSLGAFVGKNSLTADASFMGIKIAGPQIQIGPAESISLLFVLINRALLYYHHTINWAHGRRAPQAQSDSPQADLTGFTRHWPASHLKISHAYFKTLRRDDLSARQESEQHMQDIIFSCLMEISRAE